MGLFASPSPLDPHIDKATSDKNTTEDWSIILDVCDRVKEYGDGNKDCIKALTRKLTCDNPRVVLQAITLLDACVSNCGNNFLLEVASRDFEGELRKLITSPRTHSKVSQKLRQCLKSWAEGEFKGNPQLSLIPALYTKLQQEGCDFSATSDSPKKKKVEYSTDPNVVNNKQEEDDIAQAIQLSLQSSSSSPKSSSYNNARTLYPSDLSSKLESGLVISDTKGAASSGSNGQSVSEAKKARALYDFEAVEDNELTFQAGELIVVIDSSDPNWWKGNNHRGEGLFPANFVTLDIHGDADQTPARNEKRVSFSECVKVTEVEDSGGKDDDSSCAAEGVVDQEPVSCEIDDEKINLLLHLLHEADPTGQRLDDPQLPFVEERVSAMAPTIDAELEQIDKRHNELGKLNSDLMDGLNLYHQLMREMPVTNPAYYPAPSYVAGVHPAAHMIPPQHMPPAQQMAGHPSYPPMYMLPPGQQPPAPTGPPYPAMGMAGAPPPPVSGLPAPLYQPATSVHSQPEGGVGDGGVLPSYGHYPDPAAAGAPPTYATSYTTTSLSPLHQPPPPQLQQHHYQQPQPTFQQPLL